MRKSILMGEDISDDLTSSFDNFNQIANQYSGGGAALVADQLSGNLDLAKLTLPDPDKMVEGIRDARGLGKNDTIFTTDSYGTKHASTWWEDIGARMGMDRNATKADGTAMYAEGADGDAEYVKAVQERITP